ncbi:MAG: PDZ domain-containing protein [Phycisphaerae bacterium]
MRRPTLTIVAFCVMAAASGASAQSHAGESIARIAELTENALVVVSGRAETADGDTSFSGIGICVDDSGVFVSTAFDARMDPGTLKEFRLLLPDSQGQWVPAELMGIDPETGLGFVRALEDRGWEAIDFVEKAELSPGDQVISAGLFNAPGSPRCFGVAHVSSVMRVPEKMVYVTGGSLTLPGSPVFTADGRAVGIVSAQVPMRYEISTGQSSTVVALSGREQTQFFTAIDEFAHIIADPPQRGRGRRMPWIGILEFAPVPEHVARINRLDAPAVRIERVVQDKPADAAGLHEGDIIVAMNGEPVEELPTPELTAQQFFRRTMRLRVGDSVTLTVHTPQGRRDVSVEVEPMPSRPQDAARYANREVGLIVREKVEFDEYRNPALSGVSGLIVEVVAEDSPAARAGLEVGDLLTEIDGINLRSVWDFQQIVEQAMAGGAGGSLTVSKRQGQGSVDVTIYLPRQ